MFSAVHDALAVPALQHVRQLPGTLLPCHGANPTGECLDPELTLTASAESWRVVKWLAYPLTGRC
jgi:hypothetical protein